MTGPDHYREAERLAAVSHDHCVKCGGATQGGYCQICLADICRDCLIDHTHGDGRFWYRKPLS